MKEVEEYEQFDTDEEIKKKPPKNYKKYFLLFIIIALIITAFFIFKKNKNTYEKHDEKTEIIINFENNTITLTEKFKNDLINAKNPKIILCVGEKRTGKSILLNNIIVNKNKFWFDNDPFINKAPFISAGGINAITKDFNYYGPISNKELLYRNKLDFSDNDSEFEESDLFFIDSEGAFNLNEDTSNLFKSVFALESISTYILYVINSVPNYNNLETIKNELTVLNLLNKEMSFNSPELIIVANRIEHDDNFKDLSNEEKEKQTFYDSEYNINEHFNKILGKNLTFHYIIQWNLKFKSSKDDINLYWKTVQKISEIISQKSKNKIKNNAKNLMNNFESTIEIMEKERIMNSTNFKNPDEISNTFVKFNLNKMAEEEKKDKYEIYEKFVNDTINKLTNEELIQIAVNNKNGIAFFNDFEIKCKEIIKENVILKFSSIKNNKDKLEYIINEIYKSIFENLLIKGKIKLDEIKNKCEREGNEELSKKILELQLLMEDLRKKLKGEIIEKPEPVINKGFHIPLLPCSIF